MGTPIDAWSWNPRALYTFDPPPPPPPPPQTTQQPKPSPVPATPTADRPLAGFIGPLPADQEVLRSGPPPRPLEGFIGPLTPEMERLRSGPPPKLPTEIAAESRALAQKDGAAQNQEDPRAQIIDVGRQVQDVDQQVQSLAAQPVDIEAAKNQVTAANDQQSQFFQQVSAGMTPQQLRQLQPLAAAAADAPNENEGENQGEAQAEFATALEAMLTPQQRKTLLELNRASEDAQLNLQGQQIAKSIQDARLSSDLCGTEQQKTRATEVLSLANADARAFVAERQRLGADRKVQDVYAIVMTPEVREKLAQPQQELLDAANNLQQHPDDAAAKRRVDIAKASFDAAFNGLVHPQDREVIAAFEADQSRKQSLAAVLGDETTAERNYYDLRTIAEGKGASGAPTDTERRQFDLARSEFELTRHNRGMRQLALQAAATTDEDQLEDLNGQLDEAMVQSMRQHADLDVQRRQFDYDSALSTHKNWQAANQIAPVSATNASFAAALRPDGGASVPLAVPEIAPTQQAVNEALQALNTAKQERTDLDEALQPPPPKKSGWDYALDIIAGVGEIIGGVALMAFAGWTGIGAVAGGAIVVDGLFRLGHSVADAANGTVTDTPQSRLMQNFGASRETANRVDTGINLAATAPIGVGGAALTVVKSANMLLKGSGALGGLMVIDGAQAQARYAFGSDAVAPWTVTQLQHAGLSQTQANYVLAAGNLVATGGLVAAAARKGPGPVHQAFHTFDDAAATNAAKPNAPDGGGTVATPATANTRVADWYSRGAPDDIRQTVAAQALGPDASPAAVAKFAKSLKADPLVVVRELGEEAADGTIVGAASVRTNSTGSFGRDGLGHRIDGKTAQVNHVASDDGVTTQQVIAAATLGVNEFTKQRALIFQTANPEDASLTTDAAIKHQRVRRDAPDVLAPLQDVDGFKRVQRALTPESASQPLSRPEQLRNLHSIPETARINWPAGARDLVYQVDFDRPLSTFGKLTHPMAPDSYLGQFNAWFNPGQRAVQLWDKVTRRTAPEPIELQAVPPPRGRSGQTRDATLYPPHTLPPERLQSLAEADVEVQAGFGELVSLNNEPVELRVPMTVAKMNERQVVEITERDPATGQPVTAGSASLVENFGGFRGADTSRFPFLAQREPPRPGTTYLADVFSELPGGGRAAVIRAEQVARDSGARSFEFITQWNEAQNFYNKLGAHGLGTPAPKNAPIAGLEMYEARFSADAGKLLMAQPLENVPKSLRRRVARARSPEALQKTLDHMPTDLYHLVGKAPDGTLLVSYRIQYDVPTTGRTAMMWNAKDAGWFMQNKIWEPAVNTVKRPFATAANAVAPHARWLNEHVNPYGLPKGIEPTSVRARAQNAGYAATYVMKQSWATWRGAVLDAAAVQAATGNMHIVYNDDRAIRPFNGLPGSPSMAVYFPWTGTMVTLWGTGPNARGPAPVDSTGLQPLLRASAPMTDPNGPKGAGLLTAGRIIGGGEVNLGIRWFGNNDGVSAVSAASLRILPINGNGRLDVPIQSGGPHGGSLIGSVTAFMPSVSHAFYAGPSGVIVRNLHVTLSGSAQTAALNPAAQASAYRAGAHWTAGSKGVSTGTGFFLTLNPAYGEPNFSVG